MSDLRCPFSGLPLVGPYGGERGAPRDRARGDRPRVPVEVETLVDGTRVEHWHGQRPSTLPHPMRETPRKRKDGFANRQPTVRAAERRLDGVPADAHPDDAADLRRMLAPASAGRQQDRTTLVAIAALKARLPRE